MRNVVFNDEMFLSHKAKEKAVVSSFAERLKEGGLKFWFDEWEIARADGVKRKSASKRQPSAFSLHPFLELSANAFASDPGAPGLKAGTCGRGNLPFRDPLNKDRSLIPLLPNRRAITRTI